MKLSPAQIERVRDYIDGEFIPDSHAASPQLETVFGEHTFFVDSDGLNIVEPSPEDGHLGNVVKLASWADDKRMKLEPHPPETTRVVVEIGEVGWVDEDRD